MTVAPLGLLNLCVVVTRGLRPWLLAFAALRLETERGFFRRHFAPTGPTLIANLSPWMRRTNLPREAPKGRQRSSLKQNYESDDDQAGADNHVAGSRRRHRPRARCPLGPAEPAIPAFVELSAPLACCD